MLEAPVTSSCEARFYLAGSSLQIFLCQSLCTMTIPLRALTSGSFDAPMGFFKVRFEGHAQPCAGQTC